MNQISTQSRTPLIQITGHNIQTIFFVFTVQKFVFVCVSLNCGCVPFSSLVGTVKISQNELNKTKQYCMCVHTLACVLVCGREIVCAYVRDSF